jgi:hypothetical protein
MQLKIKRSQREGGIISTNVIFCLDARVEFTPDEQRNITRYKLHNQVIYNSDASTRHLDRADAQRGDGSSIRGSLKSLVSVALAAMNLNISISSLQRGHHIECKSMDELLGAEDALVDACKSLKTYLDIAATFDGREVLVDFGSDGPAIVASATPAPMTVVPASPAPALPPPEREEIASEEIEDAEYREPIRIFGVELPDGMRREDALWWVAFAGLLLLFLLAWSCAG